MKRDGTRYIITPYFDKQKNKKAGQVLFELGSLSQKRQLLTFVSPIVSLRGKS